MVKIFHLDAKNEEKVKKVLKISPCLKIYLQMRVGEWNFIPLFSYFTMYTYVEDTDEALLLSIHNICFYGEIRKTLYLDTPFI